MTKRLLFLSVLALGLAAWAGRAMAQTAAPPVSDDDVNRVARQMFCPVCENTPLDVCPTEACRQWRQTIREQLQAGWSDQQILDDFVRQYGERVLAQPSTRGLNILLWVLPPLGVLAGAAFLWRTLRQMVRPAAPVRPAAEVPPASGPQDDYLARLEAELKARK